jgi:hypothetical protein
MPFPPRLTRRRLCLAGLLLVAAALAGWAVLRSWEERSPERMKYDRIQVGMAEEEVDTIVAGVRVQWSSRTAHYVWLSGSREDNGASITVDFDADGRVADKEFHEGDQSFKARARRLVERIRRW